MQNSKFKINQVKKIAIGSTNPVKVKAVNKGMKKLFPKAKFIGIEVESGVARQPIGDEETLQGARNRAKEALTQTKSDIGVGLEGGVMETKYGPMNTVWCSLVTETGAESISGGAHFLIPEKWMERVKMGQEIGEILDEVYGGKNIKKKQGMIGMLTKNLTNRREEYTQLVKLAMVKLISSELYTSD